MREAAEEARKNEPLILWWMPVVALIGPIIAAIWFGATAEDGALGEAAFALIWPGAPSTWLRWRCSGVAGKSSSNRLPSP